MHLSLVSTVTDRTVAEISSCLRPPAHQGIGSQQPLLRWGGGRGVGDVALHPTKDGKHLCVPTLIPPNCVTKAYQYLSQRTLRRNSACGVWSLPVDISKFKFISDSFLSRLKQSSPVISQLLLLTLLLEAVAH